MADSSESGGSSAAADPERWLDDHGDCLFAVALARTRRRDVAEELVQETLLGALQTRGQFAGRSSERVWLLGILRHKIVDYFRRTTRDRATTAPERELVERPPRAFDERFFGQRHRWTRTPRRWAVDPATLAERTEFWAVFDECVSKLSPRMAEAFCLREFNGAPTSTIGDTLGVTETNLSTLLYRARMLLRDCLDRNWFATDSTDRAATERTP
ncbi:MAG: sigma-70 family RNA polymerase sigma factor [Phycisphaerales bacterium]